ncbi:SPOR domain-containing protein [Sphingomonas sp. AOB5]|uniref:SPOR domain-containing protein n=1 Tax=Sphingomonas sp. AOB5 TaxID=3034017 RepID=UPI0023FA4871|nr:SPOR domain-containing protein [Sphingomonas sp. AOB5]MDF7775758.1 SPOR domain-containing protein [Sphingomonas sp. AOB5]
MSKRSEAGFGDDDRLPWLESVEEDYREGPSIWRILLLIILALAVVGAIVFGAWWYQTQQGLAGNGQLIEAAEGDYKVKPDDAGGMKVEGEGGAAFATGEGTTTNAAVDTNAGPETPIDGQKVAAPANGSVSGTKTATVAVPQSGGDLKARAPGAPVQAPASGAGAGSLIQLGAFPDQQGAEAAWSDLSRRFPMLAPLGRSIERGEKDGKPVYRLRVNTGSNTQAKEVCAKLQAGRASCYVAN